MFFQKIRLTRHEQRCAREFEGESPAPPWDHLYEVLPFELMEMAERGEPKAAYVMGDRLDQGMDGLAPSLEKALIYYRLGEQQGDADALNNLGSMHFQGDGLPKDLDIARRYFERAVEGGCAAAMNNLGRMYLKGQGGLPVDVGRGLALLERGARLYDINAALKMQNIYHEGQHGQRRDVFRRIYWLWHAIYNGSGRACALIGDYLLEGELVRHQGHRARALYERGMILGDSYAILQLGIDYLTATGGPQDQEKALHFLTMAEQRGEASAARYIAMVRRSQAE
ncbi:tetratricopeptide repeat protein [Terrihabitans sp. B22-R8]|uniref:tetratricopeptide repeat protein n=1 Tax=Terrihabitans sp. B22-R8 TaxID=3425128 RepID=UPI00403CD2F2